MFKTITNSLIALVIILFTLSLPANADNNYTELAYYNGSQFNELQSKLNENKKEVNVLKTALIKELELIEYNKKEIKRLNEIVFFYSSNNIVDVTEAFRTSVIKNEGEISFYDTKCGFPIYNGAQRKIDKLVRQSLQANNKVEMIKLRLYGLHKENKVIESKIAFLKFRIS